MFPVGITPFSYTTNLIKVTSSACLSQDKGRSLLFPSVHKPTHCMLRFLFGVHRPCKLNAAQSITSLKSYKALNYAFLIHLITQTLIQLSLLYLCVLLVEYSATDAICLSPTKALKDSKCKWGIVQLPII